MDTLLMEGDHGVDSTGVPVGLEGTPALLQQALVRLCVRRGTFVPDRQLGSELHRLGPATGLALQRQGAALVQQALADLPQIVVRQVQCSHLGQGVYRVGVELWHREQGHWLEVETG